MLLVSYACEISSMALSEDRRLKEFEDRVLRGVSGLKADETVRGWRNPRNGELHNLPSSPKI
jgi:hypothetical protein